MHHLISRFGNPDSHARLFFCPPSRLFFSIFLSLPVSPPTRSYMNSPHCYYAKLSGLRARASVRYTLPFFFFFCSVQKLYSAQICVRVSCPKQPQCHCCTDLRASAKNDSEKCSTQDNTCPGLTLLKMCSLARTWSINTDQTRYTNDLELSFKR